MSPAQAAEPRYVIAKTDICTLWGTIRAGSVGTRVKTNAGSGRGFIDFGVEYPIASFDDEVRDAGPLEVLAAQVLEKDE